MTDASIAAIYDPAPADYGVLPYNQIYETCTTGQSNWTGITNDTVGGTNGAYCGSSTGVILTFDNQISVLDKMKMISEYGLGGVLVWDNASDIRGRTGANLSLPNSITNAVTTTVKTLNAS